MAASESFKKSHSQVLESSPAAIQQKKSSKYSGSSILCKSLILIFVLVVIPLFPSQAPDFISQSLLTNFWELIHLLFVGLAVCYGLFCKKCVEIECENRSENDTSPSAIFSGVLNYPSFFEDGVENFCISDDRKVLNGYKENFYLDEHKKIRSFTSRNECGNVCENVRENMVVISDENYKPLGLPIRSLRSGTPDIPEFTTKNGESSRLKIPVSDDNEGEVERIRGLAPSNLGKKFEEVVGPSVVPWRSRSGRMEMKGEVRNADSQSRCRPHSVGELEFDHLESRVFQYHVSSSRSSIESSSSRSTDDSSSVSIEVSKDSKLKTDNLERAGDFEDSSVMSSKSKESNIGSFSDMETRQISKYSFLNSRKKMQDQLGDANQRSSSLDLNVKSSNMFGNFKKNTVQDQLGEVNQRSSSLDLNVKSSNTFRNSKKSNAMQDQLAGAKQRKEDSSYSSAKSSNLTEIVRRAKSVRTIRSSKYVSDKLKKSENTSHQIEDNNGGMFGQVEAHVFISPVKKGEPKHSPVDKQKYTSDKVYPLPNSTVFQNQIGKGQEFADSVCDKSHQASNVKESGLNEFDEEEELAGSEVDRKADEFITKFREQIRLQKVASAKRS